MKFLTIIAVFLSINSICNALFFNGGSSTSSLNDQNRINPPNCGRRISEIRQNGNKIVGGKSADPEDWGWQVSMNISGRFACGGSLINSQWILTAAHCVPSTYWTYLYSIDIGHHDRSRTEPWAVKRGVKQIIIHPSYYESPTVLKNDIALMKLDKPVEYKNQIVPICIPDGTVKYPGRTAYVTGWGDLREGSTLGSRFLQELSLPILTDSRCKQKYGVYNVDSSIMICAGENYANKDTCQGDSGGPMVVKHTKMDGGNNIQNDEKNMGLPIERWYQAGVTSYGMGCGNGGVYARVSFYYNWIKQQLIRYA